MTAALLDIERLQVRFGQTVAVADASLRVAKGEAVGIVGESGSGKSATVLAAMRLHPPGASVTASRLSLDGHDVRTLPDRRMASLRGGFAAMIFQDPLTALNPLMAVGRQIAEVVAAHRGLRGGQARAAAILLMERVGIGDAAVRAHHFPHQFSGGMRQRVMIAAALAGDPALLIADEPTTALDVTVQADIVRLIRRLRAERDMGLVWVTHDLALMAGIVDRVVVMYAGRVMETAPVDALYAAPRHPYTVALLASLRRDGVQAEASGAPVPPGGCAFAPRCPARMARCDTAPPMLRAGGTEAACWTLAA